MSGIGRILAIDYGERRIGLALSDALGITAQPLPTYLRKDLAADLEHFKTLVRDEGVTELLIGLPLKLDGAEGPAVEKVRAFKTLLEAALGMPVAELDERMTTKQAARDLRGFGGRASDQRRRGELDRAAAQILLGVYLGMRARPAV